ncbi:hypothetical protein JCGZ_10449 [Jatropha curcas]|uniref:Uncharacterized protein n=1 Tax=Jatropha curcas TaxID=180498 RepID=A0A067KVJ2_JATCU|nr:hypothetical protein JCGZ_10449 [Jatropha curcas]
MYISLLFAFTASSEPCNQFKLVARHIYPSSRASRRITRIFKLHLDKDGYTWDVVPKDVRDFYWDEFKAEKMGRKPTPMAVFTYTHTKDHNWHTFVNKRVMGVNETYTTSREHVVSSQQVALGAESIVYELVLYLEATRVLRYDHNQILVLRRLVLSCVDEQERQFIEVRVHVMQMSCPHIDVDPSQPPTVLHPPTSLSDTVAATTDTLLTPASFEGITTHNVATSAYQLRRFDFGPF